MSKGNIMFELIELLWALVVIILGAGFLGSMFCYVCDIEFDGGVWFLSVLIIIIIAGIPIWLIVRYIKKK